MYEDRCTPPVSHRVFLSRVARQFLLSLGVVMVALGIGVLGYHLLEGLPWLDALLNASMILGGMGPINALHTVGGKLFASFYALFAGLVFVGVAGLVLAPFLHRLLHRFHWDEDC